MPGGEVRCHMKEATLTADDGREWDVELSGPPGRRDPLAAAVVTFTLPGEDGGAEHEVTFDLADLRSMIRRFSLKDAIG